MYKITKKQWDKFPDSYKSKFVDYQGVMPELVERKTVLGGCVDSSMGTTLLIEGLHFIIIDDE